jgi:hypothetical protein
MTISKERRLARLKSSRRTCSLEQAEAALLVWGFKRGRSKGHVRAWSYWHVTITMHAPHAKELDPGAVAMVIRKIEEAAALQEEEQEESNED